MLSTPYHSLIPGLFVFFNLSSFLLLVASVSILLQKQLLSSEFSLIASSSLHPFPDPFLEMWYRLFLLFFFIAQLVHQACSCQYLLVAKSETPLNYLACPLKDLPLTAACLLECFSVKSMVPASSGISFLYSHSSPVFFWSIFLLPVLCMLVVPRFPGWPSHSVFSMDDLTHSFNPAIHDD